MARRWLRPVSNLNEMNQLWPNGTDTATGNDLHDILTDIGQQFDA